VTKEREQCSFCGEEQASSNDLFEGGGPDLELPVVRICVDCARVSADAFRTERRLDEARASQPPPALRSTAEDVGVMVDWTPFSFDGRALEWSASRDPATSGALATTIRVRRVGREPAVTVGLGRSEATEEQAVRGALWLLEHEGTQTVPKGEAEPAHAKVLKSWTKLEVEGKRFEWRVDRGWIVSEKIATHLSVRDPSTGRAVAVQMEGKGVPNVEDAAITASYVDWEAPEES